MLFKQTEGPVPNNLWSTVNLVSLNYTQPLVEKRLTKKDPLYVSDTGQMY